MHRTNMDTYLVERLQWFKKGLEGRKELRDLFVDPRSEVPKKIKISDFEFLLQYSLVDNKTGKLSIKISALGGDARSKLTNKFREKSSQKNVRYDNIILKSTKALKDGYKFDTELVTINDQNTFSSLLEYFVKPLIF